jgi:hypothetical protein
MNSQIRMMKLLAEQVHFTAAGKMETRMYLGLGLLLSLVLCACAVPASAQMSDLYNNTNIEGVNNGPTRGPVFVLNAPARITQIITYHWNFRQGARPGTVALRNANGQTFGPFAVRGTSGQGGAPNVNWVADINVTVPAGPYTVLDSDPNTWSNNARSGFRGFAIVRGSLLPQSPAAPADRGSNNPDAPTLLIPAASMPSVAPNLLQQTISDGIGGSDTDDWYYISVSGPNGSQQTRVVTFVLSGFAGNIQMELQAYEQIRPPFGNPIQPRQVIATAGPQGATQKAITGGLSPGNYLLRIRWTGAPTNYTLTISTPAR